MSTLCIYMDFSSAPSSDCFSQLRDASSSLWATGATAAAAAAADVLHRPPGLRGAAAASAAAACKKVPPCSVFQRHTHPRPICPSIFNFDAPVGPSLTRSSNPLARPACNLAPQMCLGLFGVCWWWFGPVAHMSKSSPTDWTHLFGFDICVCELLFSHALLHQIENVKLYRLLGRARRRLLWKFSVAWRNKPLCSLVQKNLSYWKCHCGCYLYATVGPITEQ